MLDAVDWDQRFKLPSPSLIGLVAPRPSGEKFATFSVSTPRPVGMTAPGDFTIRVRELGREEREEGRLWGGPDGDSDEKGPEGRLK